MLLRIPSSGPFARSRDLLFVASVVIDQDIGTSGAGLPLEQVPGAGFFVPELQSGQALRLRADVVCSNNLPGGLTYFQLRVGGPAGTPLGRETGIRDNGAIGVEWFGEIPPGPLPPGPIQCELLWRSIVGQGAIRAAGPTDGEGCSFSVAVWDHQGAYQIP